MYPDPGPEIGSELLKYSDSSALLPTRALLEIGASVANYFKDVSAVLAKKSRALRKKIAIFQQQW